MSDEPGVPGGEGDVAGDPGRDFAALMSGAAATAAPAADDAPFGFTIDRETGQQRPKLAAGRPRKSPTLDELRTAKADRDAAAAETGTETGAETGDRAPDLSRRGRKKGRRGAGKAADDLPAPPYTPGVIAKGMNKLYRRAGKIVKVMDPMIGAAILQATVNTDEDGGDDTVGAAWDEMARVNPRIRRFVLRLISGGAWGQLLMAHAPILLAIILKDGISRHIPFLQLLEAFLSDDKAADEDEGGMGGLMAGLEPGDLQQMGGLFQDLMRGMAAGAPAAPETRAA